MTAIPHKDGPQTEISYRIAWVKSWLKRGLIVDNPKRAVWVLTERGRNATEREIDAVRLHLRATSTSRKKAGTLPTSEPDMRLPPLAAGELAEFSDDDWQNDLLSIIKEMHPSAFERLSRLLLLSLGFSQVEVVGRSGDGGIDILGVVKINDVLSFRVLAQC
ncbi:MAG: restriction endonuclease [Candidatus Saccharibacteria bacterium]|nr:restriction endonuclease [Pseudorhodobacter sp.]